MKNDIKHKITKKILFHSCGLPFKQTIEKAIRLNHNLTGANLTRANLTRVNLTKR